MLDFKIENYIRMLQMAATEGRLITSSELENLLMLTKMMKYEIKELNKKYNDMFTLTVLLLQKSGGEVEIPSTMITDLPLDLQGYRLTSFDNPERMSKQFKLIIER